jgi:hypothetical protein
MIKGTVIFGADRFRALSQAMKQVVEANPRRDLAWFIYETPATFNPVPASWGYPDRWFIHWDQIPG